MTAPSGTGLNSKQLALSLFQYIQQVYSIATDTEPLPARQIVSGGDIRLVAWDCDQFSVSLIGIDVDVPQQEPVGAGQLSPNALRHVALAAQIVRCAAPMNGTKPPSSDAITAVGLQCMRDAGLLAQAMFEWTTRALKPGNPNEVLAAGVGSILPVGPQGNLIGVQGSVIVSADLV